MRRPKILTATVILTFLLTGTALFVIASKESTKRENIRIDTLTTDKARYNPGDAVKVTVRINNIGENNYKKAVLKLQAYHLSERTGKEMQVALNSIPTGIKDLVIEWTAPDKDYTGYLLEAVLDSRWGTTINNATVGIDISSSALKFPRYGYLSDFSKNADTRTMIKTMTNYHINVIEYYDWQYLHHKPLAEGITRENPGVWKDWSGREIYGTVIADYISEAHKANILNMAYNMIYAGTDTFFTGSSGNPAKAENWKLYFAPDNDRGKGEFKFHMGTSPSGNGNLFFLNPLNTDWQKYIFEEENKIFRALDFDGWHGDTVGDWGNMTAADGGPLGVNEEGQPVYRVTDTYTQFLNAAKEALGEKYLSFNPVGAQGIEKANTSKTDILYAEFWPWDKDREGMSYDTYYSLVREVERSFEDSKPQSFDGKGKSLTVKAYINYDKTVGEMNDPGVILAAASVYAAGGSRLEIGNGDHMLHTEYYPDDNIQMSDNLKKYMKGMADFIVAYENLLRDGQTSSSNEVTMEDYKTSIDGKSNTVWTYSKTDGYYDILHLINLMGTDNQWRDERGKKNKPEELTDIKVKYYTDKKIENAWVASPDIDSGKSFQLSIMVSSDEKGRFISFTIPKLQYWDMIYLW